MKIKLVNRRNISQGEVNAASDATVRWLKEDFARQKPKYYVNRQRWTSQDGKTVLLDESKKLSDYGVKEGDTLIFKDLGPQVGWTTVFVTEYSGPIIVYLLFFLRPAFLYGDTSAQPLTFQQNVACLCWVGHYLKRVLETIFVHRFSNETMPLFNIFKNSGYYWGFTALIAYFVNHPLYTPADDTRFWLGLVFFLLCEISNAIIHIQLRNLRPPGTRVRGLPKGFFFNTVSCPNYTAEVFAWVSFSIMTQTFSSWLFTLAGFLQMADWAAKKHRLYRKEFDGTNGKPLYPKGRKAIIPFIL